MPTAPIPLATYLASLTMNFYDLANVRVTGDAVIQVAGGNGSVSIPVAQGVQGFSMYAGATLPTAAAPVGAVPMDKYTLTGTDGAGLPGDVYRKNGDNTWTLIGSIRGSAGHPMFVGTTAPTPTVPAGAVTGDQFLFLGTSGGNTGDVYVKASDGSWSVSGSQRGPAGPSGPAQFQERGAWAATTAYAYGDVVTNSGQRWLTKIPHTSGSTFSGTTNWISIGVDPTANNTALFGGPTRTRAPMCEVRLGAQQTLAANTPFIAGTSWAASTDPDNMFTANSSACYITLPVAGRYRVRRSGYVSSGSAGVAYFSAVTLNGFDRAANAVMMQSTVLTPSGEAMPALVGDRVFAANDRLYWQDLCGSSVFLAALFGSDVRQVVTVAWVGPN